VARTPLRVPASASAGSIYSGPGAVSRWTAWLLTLPINVYRTWISPMTGPSCRFYPSCSQYAVTALSVHGAGKGSLLAIGRICRCHPWTPGGVDAVPQLGRWRSDRYVSDAERANTDPNVSTLSPVIDARSAE